MSLTAVRQMKYWNNTNSKIEMMEAHGFNYYKNDDSSYYAYYRKEFVVDGYVHKDDGSFDDISTVGTMLEVHDLVKRFQNKYERITVYRQYVECNLDEYGWPICGDICKQDVTDFYNGKSNGWCSLL